MYRDSACKLGNTTFIVNSVTVILAVVGLILTITLKFPLHESGFFCDDDTIRFPYHPDTVSVAALFAVSAIPAILAIIVLAVISHVASSQQQTGLSSSASVIESRPAETWKSVLMSIIVQIFVLIFGFALTTLLTEMFKCTMGRLRPHFLDVCQLKPDTYNCSEGQGYVTVYNCTQTNQHLMTDARKSFLSGHASIAFYFLIFTAIYMGFKMCKSYFVLKAGLQALCLGVACFVGVSRITDNMHHPTDVIAGALLGSLFGCITAWRLAAPTSKLTPSSSDSSVQLNDVKACHPTSDH